MEVEAGSDALAASEFEAFTHDFPYHGDMAPQNFLLDSANQVCALDIGGFDHRWLDTDFAAFRVRLEHYTLRSVSNYRQSLRLWQAFWDEYRARGAGERFSFLAYLYYLGQQICMWKRQKILGRGSSSKALTSRIKTRLWIHNRLRWIRRLPQRHREALDYFRCRL